ncbi:MBOAT family protein, partial [bacterium]|nr:MBOAT family protein [bacterium]
MLFNSIEFLFIFLPIVLIVYFLLIKLNLTKFSNFWLFIASLYFYSYYKVEYLPIIISSILFNYLMGYLVQKNFRPIIRKSLMIFAIIGNLFLLCYYKYFNFLIDTINNFSFTHFDTMKLLLPLGISFFTFQQIGYITDSYKGEAKQTNIIDYALFVSFFPQLIAGPICTHKELIPQFQDKLKKIINRENIYTGIFLITIGLFKKVILADNFTDFIQNVMLYDGMKEFFTSWAFAFSIALQGYFDFSGYCDMALGIASLFNITLPINFDSPYKSKDISDYWRRWHITMGRFLKYHVYIPMGGSRCGTLRTYWNLFFVFLITGIWHGANWPCILYGSINLVETFIFSL